MLHKSLDTAVEAFPGDELADDGFELGDRHLHMFDAVFLLDLLEDFESTLVLDDRSQFSHENRHISSEQLCEQLTEEKAVRRFVFEGVDRIHEIQNDRLAGPEVVFLRAELRDEELMNVS